MLINKCAYIYTYLSFSTYKYRQQICVYTLQVTVFPYVDIEFVCIYIYIIHICQYNWTMLFCCVNHLCLPGKNSPARSMIWVWNGHTKNCTELILGIKLIKLINIYLSWDSPVKTTQGDPERSHISTQLSLDANPPAEARIDSTGPVRSWRNV